ncbi:MAG: type II toxin-antitoxin system HicB family antitoxin [Candidatus Magasanikbacteria bacterium]|nr:type II toxin-antitoxin system HicB family antitoxin [Candidatus Magasanikbacteria bacterium]
MKQQFTAIYQKRGKWYVGWVEEITGVNSQGKTLKEVRANLQEALSLIITVNRALTIQEIRGRTIREPLTLALA